MTVSAGDIIRGTMEYTAPNTSQLLNVFYWVYAGTDVDDAGFLLDAGAWAADDWSEAWETIADVSYTAVDVRWDQVDINNLLVRFIGTTAIGIPGSQLSSPVASGVAGYLQADTAVPKVRGRKFVPGLASSFLVESEWNAGGVLGLVALLASWLDGITITPGGDLIAGVIGTLVPGFIPFGLTGSTSSIPAYQRRRKKNVGS